MACPLNVELPVATLSVDQVFHVTLADGHAVVLHIEFQGRRSHAPMPWRMLEHTARLGYIYRLPLYSVVFYVGQGAGVDDTGDHQIDGLADIPTLSWQYQVIRLWQIQAEELVAVDRPVLLALVGQTHIERPEVILSAVVTRLRRVSDAEMRGRLLTAFIALLLDEEMLAMTERLLEDDTLLLDTPFLSRIREEGRMEGTLSERRRAILEALALRFTLPTAFYHDLEQHLATLTDEAHLEKLFVAAIQSPSLADFQVIIANAQ